MSLQNLITARDNLEAELAVASAATGPNYSIDGESVSLADYLKTLTEQITSLNKMINRRSPYIVRTRQYLR